MSGTLYGHFGSGGFWTMAGLCLLALPFITKTDGPAEPEDQVFAMLMGDERAVPTAQVGAAARVVHAGCKAALQEHFRICPVREESEGSTVHVAAGYQADEYRLLGRISGPAPFSGVLVHHGWKTEAVKLPRILRSSTNRLPARRPEGTGLGPAIVNEIARANCRSGSYIKAVVAPHSNWSCHGDHPVIDEATAIPSQS
jgi:hypothetical protein